MSDKVFILGITGEAGAGKDALASLIRTGNLYGSGVGIYGFADPIKEAAGAFFGMYIHQLEDREFKEAVHPAFGISPRKWMQEYGTHMRNVYGDDIWIRVLEHRLRLASPRIAIIKDVRFDVEAAWVANSLYGHLCVELIRPDNPLRIAKDHPSEQGIDRKYIDITIRNDSLEGLQQSAELLTKMIEEKLNAD